MKEQYEEIEIDIQILPKDDVITTSSPSHDNGFVDWGDFE